MERDIKQRLLSIITGGNSCIIIKTHNLNIKMAIITYKYRLELVDVNNTPSYPEGLIGESFTSWKDIKLPIKVEDGIFHYWAEGWDSVRGVKVSDVKCVLRQTYCDGVLVIEEPIWEKRISYKYRFDLIDASNSMFVPEGKTEPDGNPNSNFYSWKNIKLPVTIKDGVIRYWADGWDTVRGVMLNNVKAIIRQTYCENTFVIEEPIWKNQ